ncbi:flagellar hook-basal body protein [Paraconexibacter sp.]|uniref:flagellar hook-basal body protein n=1 Tax=Paraconexibacter sp. TaxID=2949640 RepID=UPI00356A7BE0
MYTAAAGMAAQQSRLDALSNDLANVSTTGYKHVRVAFRDLVYTQAARGAADGVGLGSGAAVRMLGRSQQQGAIRETGEPLDLAIVGEGYIAVRAPDGRDALTRDGQLRLDAQGRLVTATGGALLSPPVTLPAGTQPDAVVIGEDGTVSVGGTVHGKIRLLTVPAPNALDTGDDNLLHVTRGSGAATTAPPATLLQSGALESSTVDIGTAMTEMISTQRAYELASKAIHMQDRMAEVANGVKR